MANWHRSLTLRLSLAFGLLAILVFSALGFYLGRSADAHMAELDAHELHGRLSLIEHLAANENSAAGLARRLGDVLVGEHGVIAAVDGPNGPIFRWPDAAAADPLPAVADGPAHEPRTLTVGASQLRVIAATITLGDGTPLRAAVGRDIHHHTDFLDQLQRDFRLAMLAAALLTIAVGWWIARHGLRPLRDIAATAGRVTAGRLGERLPQADVPPELAELASGFNAMLERLDDAFQRLSNFSADLAHELRTPLHTLRMQTEVSLSKPRSADEYRDLLASNLEEYERLSRIIGDMLFLAKADNGLVVPQREAVELRALFERLIDYYGLLADEVSLTLEGEPRVVQGDRLMLERAIGNILVNAIHHTPAGGRIVIALAERAGQAEVAITNSGQPIPAEALPRLFDRFVRLDAEREGNGLGLAIARSILRAHGGDIGVEVGAASNEFRLSLPLG